MDEPAVAAPAFQRKLGLFDATMLVAGSMIGSGIFIVSADIARDVGSSGWLIVIWLASGLMTLIGALSYAELAGMLPHAGGQYVFLREAYGSLWAFLYGWTAFLVIQTGFIAAVAVAFAKYLGVLVPALGTDAYLLRQPLDIHLRMRVPWLDEPLTFFKREAFTISAGQLVAVAVVVALTALNCLGVGAGRWVQNVFTVAKTLGLLLLIGAGLTIAANAQVFEANTAEPWSGITGTAQYAAVARFAPVTGVAIVLVLCGAMVGALFSSDAWNNVTFVAGEVKDPARTLPWGLVLGTGSVVVLYLLANLAYLAALPLHGDFGAMYEQLSMVRRAEADLAGIDRHIAGVESDRARTQGRLHQLPAGAELERLAEARGTLAAAQELRARLQGLPNPTPETRRASELVDAIYWNSEALRFIRVDRALKAREVRELRAELALRRGIDHAKDDRVATAVLERVSPGLGVGLMALAIMVSTFGCINGLTLMGPRLYYAMANDGLFFQSVGRLNRAGVPAAGLVLQGAWSIVLIFSGSYSELLDYIIFAALLFYVLTVLAVFVLRRQHPDWPRPYRAFGYPVVPALYIALCAGIALALLVVKPVYSWPSFLIVLTGIPVYLVWRRRAMALPRE